MIYAKEVTIFRAGRPARRGNGFRGCNYHSLRYEILASFLTTFQELLLLLTDRPSYLPTHTHIQSSSTPYHILYICTVQYCKYVCGTWEFTCSAVASRILE